MSGILSNYEVIIAKSAEDRLREMLLYLRDVKNNLQAAQNVYNDYVKTR